jgi:hypothetical protein
MSVHERTEHVERRAVTQAPLQLHVELDLIERHVTGPLDHHLAAVAPRALGELAERLELRELRAVGGVGQSTRDAGRRRSRT